MSWLELRELLFPVHCFGCNALGLDICSNCRKYWNPHLYQRNIQGLTVYSSITYSKVAKSILLSAKEESIKLADDLIVSALVNCIKRLPTHLLRNAMLLPIPGSKKAIRNRGRDFILEITNLVSEQVGIPVINGLRINRRLLDQSRLSASDRARNIRGAFEFLPDENSVTAKTEFSNRSEVHSEIFLVDDLVTSGATLLEAKRALKVRGITVNRAITACVAESLNIGL